MGRYVTSCIGRIYSKTIRFLVFPWVETIYHFSLVKAIYKLSICIEWKESGW